MSDGRPRVRTSEPPPTRDSELPRVSVSDRYRLLDPAVKEGSKFDTLRKLLIEGGRSDAEILAEVERVHGTRTTLKRLQQTRSILRHEGHDIPKIRPGRRAGPLNARRCPNCLAQSPILWCRGCGKDVCAECSAHHPQMGTLCPECLDIQRGAEASFTKSS